MCRFLFPVATVEESVECESCSIHPDSIDQNLVTCANETIQCPVEEGCWVREHPIYRTGNICEVYEYTLKT